VSRPKRGDGSEIVEMRFSMWAEEHRDEWLKAIDDALVKLSA
jgi:hypothetical protein